MTTIKGNFGSGVTAIGSVKIGNVDKPGLGWGQKTTLTAIAGRMNKFAVPVPGSVEQADGTFALDLNNQTGPTTINFDHGGQSYSVAVEATKQRDGWGPGDFYMLETDEKTRDLIVEPGRNHRKWYATMDAGAWTRASIAAAEGVSESTISNAWLIAHPEKIYGASEAEPILASTAASAWREAQTGTAISHWLMLERGYDYNNLDVTPRQYGQGESPLHPLGVTSWGTGARPRGIFAFNSAQCPSHFAIWDVSYDSIGSLYMWNWLIADCDNVKGDNAERAGEFGANCSAHAGQGFTAYRTDVLDVHLNSPKDGMITWGQNPHKQRLGGSYLNNVYGCLLQECIYDHNGWADGYDPTGAGGANTPQPPSKFSHNTYYSTMNRDLTYDHIISARAASQGFQTRCGGYFIDCLALDNNMAGNDGGGLSSDYTVQGHWGNYSLHLGTVLTSAGYRIAPECGSYNWGFDVYSKIPVLLDCIVMHRADPDNPAEQSSKPEPGPDYRLSDGLPQYFNNLMSYEWDDVNRNTSGISTTTLDQTSIQRHAADLTEQPTATIEDYMAHIRGLPLSDRREAIAATLRYFRAPWASKLDQPYMKRVSADECVFNPDDRGEGFRWDNRLNWSSGDIAGDVDGDSVDLHGNRVKFLRFSKTISGMTFGGGSLEVASGKLTAEAHADAANVLVRECGQYFAPAGTGTFEAQGGRLAFTGAASGDLAISGMAEVLLGPDYTVGVGKTLRIDGGRCFVGWDGTGTSALTIAGTLDFRATPILAFSEWQMNARFKQGWPLLGAISGFTGKLDSLRWGRRNNVPAWEVAVRDMQGTPQVDEVAVATSPFYDDDKTKAPKILSVQPSEIGSIAAFRSGLHGLVEPTVKGNVVLEAGATVTVDTQGLASGSYDLIVANSITDNGATLPAGISVLDGRILRLTVV